MKDSNIVSPCISVCKTDPISGKHRMNGKLPILKQLEIA